MGTDICKAFSLDQELLNAIRLIRAGLGQLQSIGGSSDFYHLPILTLANGFERLMKAILCFRELEVSGEYPGPKFFPAGRKGHDLDLLPQRIKKECFLEEYVDRIPVASEDLKFLMSRELADFVGVLSRFGQSARYYHFDVVLGRDPKSGDPEAEWQRLETSIALARPDLLRRIKRGDYGGEVGREVRSLIVGRLERFARALSRLFTIGHIGQEAKRYVGYIGGFLHLCDDQLGQTIYDPCGQGL